jgi:glycerol dehydrogenase-like iron-containing ADH family enzyme
LHGEQIGIGTVIMARYHELYNPIWWSRERYPNYQSEGIMTLLKKVGAPTNPSQIGIGRELAREAFLHAWEYRKERYTIVHKRHPTRDDVEKIMAELGM